MIIASALFKRNAYSSDSLVISNGHLCLIMYQRTNDSLSCLLPILIWFFIPAGMTARYCSFISTETDLKHISKKNKI